ncbi:MAG: hypothetical protein U0359_23295 [Byssovorax sp.]
MAQLVISVFFLFLALVAGGIYWIVEQAREQKRMAHRIDLNPRGGGFGGPPGGYGLPPMGGGYGQAPMGGGYGQAPYGAPGGYAPAAAQTPPGQGAIRLVLRPDCTFNHLSDCMSRAGLRVMAPPGPPVQPGEPASALWQGEAVQIRYAFDPGTTLRSLEIQGPGAHAARQALLGTASLPALDGPQIAGLLQSPRPADQWLGLAAAEHLGPGPEAQMYGATIGALTQSREPAIAQNAQRVGQRLGLVR